MLSGSLPNGGASDESIGTPKTDAVVKASRLKMVGGLRDDEDIVRLAKFLERELFRAWQERNAVWAEVRR